MSRFRTLGEARRSGELVEHPPGSCRWCGQKVPKPGKRFCSGTRATFDSTGAVLPGTGHGCAHEWAIRGDTDYARRLVFARDRGVCESCKRTDRPWQADHIVAVIEGGGLADLSGLRTLCVECHKDETAILAARRAHERPAGPLPRTVTCGTLTRDGSLGCTRSLVVVRYDDDHDELVCSNSPYPTMHWRFPVDGDLPTSKSTRLDAPRPSWQPYRQIALAPSSRAKLVEWADRHRAELARKVDPPPPVALAHEIPSAVPWPPRAPPLTT